MRPKMDEAIRAEAIELLARGERSADVARHYEMSLVTLNRHIRRTDVKEAAAHNAQRQQQGLRLKPVPKIRREVITPLKKGPAALLTPEQLQLAGRLLAAGEHPEDVGNHLNCTERTIRKFIPANKVAQLQKQYAQLLASGQGKPDLPEIIRKERRRKQGPESAFTVTDRYIATALLLKGLTRDVVAEKYKISSRYLSQVVPGQLLDEYRRDGLPEFEDFAPAGTIPPTTAQMMAIERIQPRLSANLQQSFNRLNLLAVPLHAASSLLAQQDARLTRRGISANMLWEGFVALNEKLHAHYSRPDAPLAMKTALWQRYGLQGYTPARLKQSRDAFIRQAAHETMGDGNANLRRDVMLIVRPGDKTVLGELWLDSRNRNPLAGAIPTLLLDPAIKSVAKIKEQFVLLACKTAAHHNFSSLVVEAHPPEANPIRQVVLSPVEALTRIKAKSLLRAETEAHPLLPRTRSQQRASPCYRIDLAPFAT